MEKMTDIRERILYEDREILVCRKPAGLAVQSARPGVPDMESLLKNYLAAGNSGETGCKENSASGKNRKSGKNSGVPWLAVVHRLDQPVEGVLVFAKTSQAAKELSRQIAAGEMEKIYLAVTCGEIPEKKGVLEDTLKKDGRTNTSFVVPEGTPGGKRAVLSYELLEEQPLAKYPYDGAAGDGGTAGEKKLIAAGIAAKAEKAAIDRESGNCREGMTGKLLRIHLQTGRHHQIRVQMAHAGMPLLGDHKYGMPKAAGYPLALCAWSLTFRHPVTRKIMNFRTVPEGKGFIGFQMLFH